jgi:kynureninase
MNSLTVNLHLLMASFYQPTRERHKIVIEKGAFPSDRYAVGSQIKFHGFDAVESLVEIGPRHGETTLRTGDIVEHIEKEGNSIALVMFGGVNYYTGQTFEMREITAAAHRVGAFAGFDLAHAAGNIQLEMHDCDADFAAWCSYKYLNGGPGAVAGAFVHERHADCPDIPRLAGWWGHDKATRFKMGPDFIPLAGAEGWQVSNPPILQMAALRASLEIFDEAGMNALVERSRRLTGYLAARIERIRDDRIEVITPPDESQRGCQLSIRVKNGDRGLYARLADDGVVADWREPDVIRVAPVPLYNTFTDIERFIEILKTGLE